MEGSKLLTCDQLLDVFQSLGMQSIVDVETDGRVAVALSTCTVVLLLVIL